MASPSPSILCPCLQDLKAGSLELEIEAEADQTTSTPPLWVDGFYGP